MKGKMKKKVALSVFVFIFWLICYLEMGLVISLFIALIPLGGLMNLFACYRNKGMMPIYWPNTRMQGLSDGKHVIEKDKSKIRCFYLCDIIHIPLLSISIGDIVSTCGICVGVYGIVVLLF